MTAYVAMTAYAVNNPVRLTDDSCSRRRQDRRVELLADRIHWVSTRSGAKSIREFSEAAGLGQTTLGSILARLDKDPESGIDSTTAVKVAAHGKVTIDWLLTGKGRRDAEEGEIYDAIYGALGRALIDHPGRWTLQTVEAGKAFKRKLDGDKTEQEWIDFLNAIEHASTAEARPTLTTAPAVAEAPLEGPELRETVAEQQSGPVKKKQRVVK